MFCSECGNPVADAATVCMHCGVPVAGAKPEQPATPGVERYLIPVGRSGYAMAAGYLGLLSIFLVFAPFAILFGVLAVIDINKHPHKLGMVRAVTGISMGTLFTLVDVFVVGKAFLH